MKKIVGFDQKVQLHQLDYMARELPRTDPKELYEKMDDYLARDIGGQKARRNTRTIIFKIWCHVPEAHQPIQQRAIQLFPSLPPAERLLLHWGLTILSYPFVKDFVQEMGYLFRMQDEVSSEQIGRRMKSLYGDRRRVEVATGAVLMSLRSWGVIHAHKQHRHTIAKMIQITSLELKQWLTEVLLRATQSTAMTIEKIHDHPLFFPFEFTISIDELKNDQFSITRQGGGMVMVGLKSRRKKQNASHQEQSSVNSTLFKVEQSF